MGVDPQGAFSGLLTLDSKVKDRQAVVDGTRTPVSSTSSGSDSSSTEIRGWVA